MNRQNHQEEVIINPPLVPHAMLGMWIIIATLTTLSLISAGSIYPTGGIVGSISYSFPLVFIGLIIINLILIFALRSLKPLLCVCTCVVAIIVLMTDRAGFISDMIWTNLYMKFDITPGYGGRDRSLNLLLSGLPNGADTCARTVIGGRLRGDPDDLPLNDLCQFMYRGWSTVFHVFCAAEVVYVRKQNDDVRGTERTLRVLAEHRFKVLDEEFKERVNYYIPANSGVLTYKTCYTSPN